MVLSKEMIFFTKGEEDSTTIFDSIPLEEVRSIERTNDSPNEKTKNSTSAVPHRTPAGSFGGITVPRYEYLHKILEVIIVT